MNLRDAAAANNAAWCAEVCTAHGITGEWSPAAWTSPRRTPRFYPDAVTLTPHTTAADLTGRIDAGPGCSVKDSYATLDLPDFETLFTASWIAAPPVDTPQPQMTDDPARPWLAGDPARPRLARDPARPRPAGDPVWPRLTWSTDGDREAWSDAWSAAAGETTHPFARLRPERVTFLHGTDGDHLMAGGIAYLAAGVVSLSSVFGPPDLTWPDLRRAVSATHPGIPVVGYERGTDLAHAEAAGFHRTGPLRVLHRPATPSP